MATIRAFRATRYARVIPEVVAPPYDVISPEQRAELVAQSPYNIVQLTMPENGESRYQRANQILQHWLREGILRTDTEPALYRYTQKFIDPLTQQERARTGYFVLLHTEPYESGTVLPHEHTFPGVKEDRFRLLEATRTHLEAIFGLFEPTPEFREAVQGTLWEPVAQLEGANLPEGHFHLLERLTDPVAVSRIERAFEPMRIWIADGHHRYETALRFGLQYGRPGSPERFLPILLVPIDDPGLVILPTHRLLSVLPPGNPEAWRARLTEAFEVAPFEPTDGASLQGAIGFVWQDGAWRITPKHYAPVDDLPEALVRFDAWQLHHRVMPAMGLVEPDARYTRSFSEALRAVRNGQAACAFLLNPPPLATLQAIAASGGKMPHKSTYFHPKVLSGLITWRLDS